MLYKEPGKRPVMLVSYTPAKGWSVFESALQSVVGNPEATSVALLADMKQWLLSGGRGRRAMLGSGGAEDEQGGEGTCMRSVLT